MILCVYHGSSFKEVNTSQTANITAKVKSHFKDMGVIECYYSTHVLRLMERRGTPLLSFEQALQDNYNQHSNIYVLITNMMNGAEYQNVLEQISKIDSEGKVKATNYLLAKEYIYDVAEAIKCSDEPTLFIGHGNTNNNSDYQRLNSILKVDDNIVTTLRNQLEPVLNEHFISKRLVVRPLMITSAYHAKRDIEAKLYEQLTALGYKPTLDLRPLSQNDKLIDVLINNLSKLIDEQENLI